MVVAIVGSRSFREEGPVAAFVNSLPADWTVVSGGADGPDTFAASAARARGMAVTEFLPQDDRYDFKVARLERNKLVVAAADCLVGFVDLSNPTYNGRRGGTLDAVRIAVSARKPVRLVAAGELLPTWEELQALVDRARPR